MKKVFLVLVGALMMCAVQAQVVEQDEAALVYYSPKTSVSIDFSYTVETRVAGQFAQYAEEMIGVKDAVKENKTVYKLTDARIGTYTSTDYSRPHKVVAEDGIPMLLSISPKNLLRGYNMKEEAPASPAKRNSETRREHPHNNKQVAPYPEEVLKASTPKAQAHAVAQQILHLREMRMYLLSGEVEHAPADGEAMRLVLAELDKQEKALTELFIGKKQTRVQHKEVRFEPSSKDQQWFFSEENGFTDAENVEAEAINVNVLLYPQRYVVNEVIDPKAKKKKTTELSQIVYNLPGSGDVKVRYKGEVLASRTIPIAQLGVDVPLAKDLFTGKELPVIVFSEKTGNIVSISR